MKRYIFDQKQCILTRKRPDLAFLKDVLYGCEEGEKEVLHFLYKENTENLKKVIDAVKKHPYMELFGKYSISGLL